MNVFRTVTMAHFSSADVSFGFAIICCWFCFMFDGTNCGTKISWCSFHLFFQVRIDHGAWAGETYQRLKFWVIVCALGQSVFKMHEVIFQDAFCWEHQDLFFMCGAVSFVVTSTIQSKVLFCFHYPARLFSCALSRLLGWVVVSFVFGYQFPGILIRLLVDYYSRRRVLWLAAFQFLIFRYRLRLSQAICSYAFAPTLPAGSRLVWTSSSEHGLICFCLGSSISNRCCYSSNFEVCHSSCTRLFSSRSWIKAAVAEKFNTIYLSQ